MKVLVKKSIVFALASLFVIAVSAQRPDKKSTITAEERASRQTEMMTKQLDLTEEQQAKVKEIHLKHSQQMADHKKQATEAKKQNRENMKTQMEAKDAELKQVLTPEQYEKWQTKKQENRKPREKVTENRLKKHNKSEK
jgi:Spy/CpxP family protein refolding chaperone